MIRVVTLDEFDRKLLQKFCQHLYTAFGVGSELTAEQMFPQGLSEPYDAEELLSKVGKVSAYKDDKVLYLTSRKLSDRRLRTGIAPTPGYCHYNGGVALVTTHPKKSLEENLKLIARHALHQVGHLWELHHCLDPRCSMYPPWTPSFVTGDAIFCTFCRDKSEQKIRLANS